MDTSFRELVKAAPDAILEVDQAGIIRLASEEAGRVFGEPRDKLIGGKRSGIRLPATGDRA